MARRDQRSGKPDQRRTLLGAFFRARSGGESLPGCPPEAWLRRAAAQGDREAQEQCRALGLRWGGEEE